MRRRCGPAAMTTMGRERDVVDVVFFCVCSNGNETMRRVGSLSCDDDDVGLRARVVCEAKRCAED